MTILQIIQRDIDVTKFRMEMFLLKPKNKSNQITLDELSAILFRLKEILKSGFALPSYTSIIDKRTYYPSLDELHLPQPPENHSIFCYKRSRKESSISKSEFTLYHSEGKSVLSFLVEHSNSKSYPKGGCGRVKQAFFPGDEEKKYALKIFKKEVVGVDGLHALRVAMRSAFCNRILGHTGYAFRRAGKQYILSDWLQGNTLDKTSKDKIIAMPVCKRIILALNLIREIAILHKHGIFHNDIKPSNIMLSDNALHLLDLDSVRLENEYIKSIVGPICTPRFLDAQTNFDLKTHRRPLYGMLNAKSDIYALGLTLTFLFPDILFPNYEILTFGILGGGSFKFDSIKLYYGPKFKANEQLGRLIYRLSSVIVDDRLVTIDEVYAGFKSCLSTSYSSASKDVVLPSVMPLESISLAITGKDAFKEIENEILFFNARRLRAKEAIERSPLPKIQQKIDSSFYLFVGASVSIFAVMLLNKSRLSSSFVFNNAQIIMGLGAAAFGGYRLFKTMTSKNIGQDMFLGGEGESMKL